MGIKGTVRRSTDAHVIHSNVDTDIIVAEEAPFGSMRKPEEIYSIIEHFCLVSTASLLTGPGICCSAFRSLLRLLQSPEHRSCLPALCGEALSADTRLPCRILCANPL
jgi:hypothetical protein